VNRPNGRIAALAGLGAGPTQGGVPDGRVMTAVAAWTWGGRFVNRPYGRTAALAGLGAGPTQGRGRGDLDAGGWTV